MAASASSPRAEQQTPARATRREWTGLAVIALPCAVVAMDLTVLNLAMPAISTELKPSASQLLWIIDIYGFLVAGFLITMGTLGDRIGRRRLLLVGAAAFGAASLLAAFAESAEALIAMRALLGVAGATVAPSTMSLIRNMFHDAHERQFAIGLWIASYSAGAAIGPLVGGVLLQFFDWGAVFLVAVPVMALVLLLGPALLPEYRDPGAGRVDPASVVLSLGAVLAVVYALKHLAEYGIRWPALAIGAAGLALGVAFVRRQRGLAYPLLDLRLFRSAAFSAAITAYGLTSLAMMGVYIFIAQYLQLVRGLSPLEAGFATLPWALAFIAGSLAAPRLARRVPRVALLAWSLAFSALGFLLLVATPGPYGLAVMIAGAVVMSLGMAPVIAIGNEMMITTAPPERAGAASALAETAAEFSGAAGIALFGSLGTVVYAWALARAWPAGLPTETAEAALATLGGAAAAAEAIGGPAGAALQAAAREAFTLAMQVAAVAGALIVLLACALTVRILGRGKARASAAQADAGASAE
ncbi:MAG: MFS transporter [Betaproteobacteria bacterium]|nr:MFS transporter [Betaproteobacteria bacterium]